MSLRQLKFKPILLKGNSCIKEQNKNEVVCTSIKSTSDTVIGNLNSKEPIQNDSKNTDIIIESNKHLTKCNIEVRLNKTVKCKDEILNLGIQTSLATSVKLAPERVGKEGRKRHILKPEIIKDQQKTCIIDLIHLKPFRRKSIKKLRQEVTYNQEELQEDSSKKSNSDSEDDIGNVPLPQLKVSKFGTIVIDDNHLTVERTIKKPQPSKSSETQGWSYKNTVLFYKALSNVGPDFEAMRTFFPKRSRRNLKNKFKKEEKLHGDLIDKLMPTHNEHDLKAVLEELYEEKKYYETIKCLGKNLTTVRKKDKFKNH